ncbi:MAG: hypothetical protein RLZZ628_3906 [Bacteroidota bacterium]|jgi:hypothetical protein
MFKYDSWVIILVLINFVLNTLSAQIVNVEDKRVKLGDTIAFKGFADIGFNLYQTDKRLLSGRANVQMEYVHHRHFFLSMTGYNFVQADKTKYLNDGFQHLRYNYEWTPDEWVWEGFVQAQYNERTRILFRGLAGTGVRWKLQKYLKQKVYLGILYMFERNELNKTEVLENNHRLSSYLSFNFKINSFSKFSSTTYFQPLLNQLNNYRLASESALVFGLSKKWSFKGSFTINYDNDPRLPVNFPDLTYNWVNGLRYDF